jgi:hypothetical protein
VDTKEENINKLAIFPNPAKDYFQLENPEGVASEVILYDLLGREVAKFDATNTNRFFIGEISEGRYFARIFDKSGQAIKVMKIIKKYDRP